MPSVPARMVLVPIILTAAGLAGCVADAPTATPSPSTPAISPRARATTWVTVTATAPTPRKTVWVTATATAAGSSAASSVAPAPSGPVLAALRALPVKGKAAKTGYSRALFGQAYTDADRNGCDTRNDALRRDLSAVVIKEGTRGCVVLSGELVDPYTGRQVPYLRGKRSRVDFEHVVALENAWETGAQGWDEQKRTAFANDPLNVLMAGSESNRGKGSRDASGWLPPAKDFRCSYVARQVSVKAAYSLWVTTTEREAMERVLATCPGHPLPGPAQVAFPSLP